MKRTIAAIWMTGALLLLGTACGESTVEPAPKPAGEGEAADPGAGNEAGADRGNAADEGNGGQGTFKIGDTVKFDNLLITLNSVKSSKGSEFETPEHDQYLLLDLTIENAGKESETVSTLLQMMLYDAESYSYDIALYTGTQGSVDGEIGPGRKVRGEVAFDVPSSASYEFVFEDPFTSGQAIWSFDASAVAAE